MGRQRAKKKKKKKEEAEKEARAEQRRQALTGEYQLPQEDARQPAQPPQTNYAQVLAEPEGSARDTLEHKFYLLLEAEARKAHETIEPGRTYALMERDRPTGRCSMVVGAVHEVPGTGRVWTAVHNFEPTAQGQVTGVDGMVTQGPFSLPTERDSARHRRLFRFLGPIRTHPSVQRQAFSQAATDAFDAMYMRNGRDPMEDPTALINEWYRLLRRGDTAEARRRREKAAPQKFPYLSLG